MSEALAITKFLSPPTIARQLGVKAERVVGWIKAGQLRGFNLAEPGSRRPRYKVDPIDLQAFLNKKAVTAMPKAARRRRQPAGVTEFF